MYGTQTEPLFKCADIIVRLLKYKDSSKAKWFDRLKMNSEYVITPLAGGYP
jgi:hypothetical protein